VWGEKQRNKLEEKPPKEGNSDPKHLESGTIEVGQAIQKPDLDTRRRANRGRRICEVMLVPGKPAMKMYRGCSRSNQQEGGESGKGGKGPFGRNQDNPRGLTSSRASSQRGQEEERRRHAENSKPGIIAYQNGHKKIQHPEGVLVTKDFFEEGKQESEGGTEKKKQGRP